MSETNGILERLAAGPVIGDGGALFELERRGYVAAGPFTPEVVLEQPEAVRQMHVDYARAGADVIQALTYYAHKSKLEVRGLGGRIEELNRQAVRIAREVAGQYGRLVAGNLSNTWLYRPDDPDSAERTREQFAQQVKVQAEEGVDFFIAETFEMVGEAELALQCIAEADRPAMITMGFKYDDRARDDYSLAEAFARLEQAGAQIVGINCFRDWPRMQPLAARLREAVSCYTATQPVAFACTDERPYFQAQLRRGRVAFPLELEPLTCTRREMADYATEAAAMGIEFIGSCCGSGPQHVRAMAEALDRETPNSRYSPQLDLHPIIGTETQVRETDPRILAEQRQASEAGS